MTLASDNPRASVSCSRAYRILASAAMEETKSIHPSTFSHLPPAEMYVCMYVCMYVHSPPIPLSPQQIRALHSGQSTAQHCTASPTLPRVVRAPGAATTARCFGDGCVASPPLPRGAPAGFLVVWCGVVESCAAAAGRAGLGWGGVGWGMCVPDAMLDAAFSA